MRKINVWEQSDLDELDGQLYRDKTYNDVVEKLNVNEECLIYINSNHIHYISDDQVLVRLFNISENDSLYFCLEKDQFKKSYEKVEVDTKNVSTYTKRMLDELSGDIYKHKFYPIRLQVLGVEGTAKIHANNSLNREIGLLLPDCILVRNLSSNPISYEKFNKSTFHKYYELEDKRNSSSNKNTEEESPNILKEFLGV